MLYDLSNNLLLPTCNVCTIHAKMMVFCCFLEIPFQQLRWNHPEH